MINHQPEITNIWTDNKLEIVLVEQIGNRIGPIRNCIGWIDKKLHWINKKLYWTDKKLEERGGGGTYSKSFGIPLLELGDVSSPQLTV